VAPSAPSRSPQSHSISSIGVRLRVGDTLMAASDDPLFLGLSGDSGREFRLALARGKSLRRGQMDHFRLGPPDDPATNVDHAELNDPTTPGIDAETITGVYLQKGFEPIPNVRGVGEMDDRLEVLEVEVEIEVQGEPKARRYLREGPIWLGLVSGLRVEVPRVDEGE
jgi:hypothetical protein